MFSSRINSIASLRNPLLKQIRKALEKGTLTADGFCVVEGEHLLEEALRSHLQIEAVLSPHEFPEAPNWIEVPDTILSEIATTKTSPKVITLVRLQEWSPEDLNRPPALHVILDQLQDPGNAGTILRSAEAFSASGVTFRTGTVSPYNPKLIRASAGSIFRVPFLAGNHPVSVPLYAADPHRGVPLHKVDWTKPCAIVIGSEAHGISAEMEGKATPVRIPTHHVESLNAGISASLILYEIARQREFI